MGSNPAGRAIIVLQYQALTANVVGAFLFNITSAGVLRDPPSHTRFAASTKFSNSAAE